MSVSYNPDETVVCFVDGSCFGNGTADARAGWGVWWHNYDLKHLNKAGRLAGDIQSNNRAELTAMIEAVQRFGDDDRQLIIFTDSSYGLQAINKWLPDWERYGWTTAAGRPVKNQDLITLLDFEMGQCYYRPELRFVQGHSNSFGNYKADRMAKHGAKLRRPDWY